VVFRAVVIIILNSKMLIFLKFYIAENTENDDVTGQLHRNTAFNNFQWHSRFRIFEDSEHGALTSTSILLCSFDRH